MVERILSVNNEAQGRLGPPALSELLEDALRPAAGDGEG